MKNNPYNREKAKVILEEAILDKIKQPFKFLKEKMDKQNEENKKVEPDLQQADTGLKKLANMLPKLRNLIMGIDASKKLPKKKIAEQRLALQNIFDTFNSFVEQKKQFPVKVNDYFMRLINKTDEFLQEIDSNLNRANSSRFSCSSSSFTQKLDAHVKTLNEYNYFWQQLYNLDAREGYQEIHHAPPFDESDFRNLVKNLLENNLPQEQQPIITIQKEEVVKRVEVPSYDKVRLAHELLTGVGRSRNVSDAMWIYHREAERGEGNEWACNTLGQIYLEGIYVPQDLNKSFHYYSQSEKLGNKEAKYRKGTFYERNLLNDTITSKFERIKKALDLYEEASPGCLDAMTDLGYIYHHGIKDEEEEYYIIDRNVDIAKQKYKMAAKEKFPRALNNLGLFILQEERNNPKSLLKAIKYFEEAMNFGYVKAGFHLAYCYENGIVVERNLEKAVSLYKESGLKGDLTGKLFYAYHTLKKTLKSGNDLDIIEAARMLIELTYGQEHNQNPEVYYLLGITYENGLGFRKDYQIALSYYTAAAKFEFPPALNKLGDFYNTGIGVVKDQKKAFEYYERAASLQDRDALVNLGAIYEEGGYNEILRDYDKAYEFYSFAAELNDSRGFLNIGYMHEKGLLGEPNLEKALEFYERAAELGNATAKNILSSKNGYVGYYSQRNQKKKNYKCSDDENDYPEILNRDSILPDNFTSHISKRLAQIKLNGFDPSRKYEEEMERK